MATLSDKLAPIHVLQDLTAGSSRFLIWKNVERAVEGAGDLDCAAPHNEWLGLRDRLDGIARQATCPPFVSCSHLPGVLLNVTVDTASGDIFEVDFCDRQTFRGRTLFTADSLTELAYDDPRGFRRLRPGAEAIYLTLLKAISRSGSVRPEVARSLATLAEQDPGGAELAAMRLGRIGRNALALLRGAEGWSRSDGIATQAFAANWLLTHPSAIADRVRMRRSILRPCSVIAAALGDRKVANPEQWLANAAHEHNNSP